MSSEQAKGPDTQNFTWFVKVDGELAGPFATKHIHTLLKLQKIARDQTLYCKEKRRWGKVYEFSDFDRRLPSSGEKPKVRNVNQSGSIASEGYYTYVNGIIEGPFQNKLIKAQIKNQKINFSTLLGKTSAGPWKKIGDLPEFDRRRKSATPPDMRPEISESIDTDNSFENIPEFENNAALLDYFKVALENKNEAISKQSMESLQNSTPSYNKTEERSSSKLSRKLLWGAFAASAAIIILQLGLLGDLADKSKDFLSDPMGKVGNVGNMGKDRQTQKDTPVRDVAEQSPSTNRLNSTTANSDNQRSSRRQIRSPRVQQRSSRRNPRGIASVNRRRDFSEERQERMELEKRDQLEEKQRQSENYEDNANDDQAKENGEEEYAEQEDEENFQYIPDDLLEELAELPPEERAERMREFRDNYSDEMDDGGDYNDPVEATPWE